jgi:hypothetical protein
MIGSSDWVGSASVGDEPGRTCRLSPWLARCVDQTELRGTTSAQQARRFDAGGRRATHIAGSGAPRFGPRGRRSVRVKGNSSVTQLPFGGGPAPTSACKRLGCDQRRSDIDRASVEHETGETHSEDDDDAYNHVEHDAHGTGRDRQIEDLDAAVLARR